jgi:hypothetical protein
MTEHAFSLFLASIAPDHYIYLYQRIFISAKASVPGLVENCTISDSIKQSVKEMGSSMDSVFLWKMQFIRFVSSRSIHPRADEICRSSPRI